ncbi:MAG: tetratricopeptide repeat protein [Verrucomicrobia bacterium]|nr:tetratricopeptide repeat protein [Verrucomicrobiota bacterium]
MPEKNLSAIARPQRDLYERGNLAVQRQNYDYAITMLSQVLQHEPAFYLARQALRTAQIKKGGTVPGSGGTSFFKKVLGGASSSPQLAKAQMALRKDPIEAIQIAEEILNSDPWNNSAHKLLAEAAVAADFPRTAILSLEMVLRNSPKDREVSAKLAELCSKSGDVKRAEAIYEELMRAHPHDPEIAQAFKNLTAHQTLSEGGYEKLADGTGSYRDALRDKDEAVKLEQENREVKTTDVADQLIREYEGRVVAEPKNLKLLRNLAELHAQKKEFDRALEYYHRIKAAESGGDPSLDKAISDTTLKKIDWQLSQLDPTAPDYQDQVARVQAERQVFELGECRQRVDRYPTDLQIRFEYGELLFKAGKIGEAIAEFQKAQQNPARRLQAMSYLGLCFARRNMNDLAARTLQNAIKEKLAFDDEKKDLIYALGCVLEKMGKNEEAIEQFKQIYEVDIGYKDVAAKVDAFYAAQG